MSFDYDKYLEEQAVSGGFAVGELTSTQIELVLQPSEAPENFMCDGEISYPTALRNWKVRLENSGLSKLQISKAIKLNK